MMSKALENFAAGVIGTLAFGAVCGLVIWAEISVLMFFEPRIGVFGAMAAFVGIAAICVGVVAFVVTLFGEPKKPAA